MFMGNELVGVGGRRSRRTDEPVAEIVPNTQPIHFKNANLSRRKPLRVLISTDFRER
jgi:hypothetical protein